MTSVEISGEVNTLCRFAWVNRNAGVGETDLCEIFGYVAPSSVMTALAVSHATAAASSYALV